MCNIRSRGLLQHRFWRDEDGAVTVDWVVLTAAMVGLGIAAASVAMTGVNDVNNSLTNSVSTMETGFSVDENGNIVLNATRNE